MIYQLPLIERDIRITLDENAISDNLLTDLDTDTLTLNELIKSKVIDATREVVMEAPTYMLESGHHFGDVVFWNADGVSGWIILPHDFMRLITFKMTSWERPVFAVLLETDASYKLQHSRYKGLRGTPQKPKCAIITRPEGRTLEFWSCKTENDTVERAVYQPLPRIDDDDGIDIPEKLYRPIVYQAAALVAAVLGGNADSINTLMQTAKGLLK